MNETQYIIEDIKVILRANALISNNIRSLASYFNLSHTSIYNMIKEDRISIKLFKMIKQDPILKHININDIYIINNILRTIND